MGGEISRDLYLANHVPVAKEYMESMNILAGVGGKKKLKYEVDIPQSVFRYFKYKLQIIFK